ncbi:unnamed protein product, partial [Rotaria sp. Silwood1]
LFKVNFWINGNDSAIRRKNSCSKGCSSNKDISRTHSNNPPEKLFAILLYSFNVYGYE